MPKMPKIFECELCDFICFKQSNLNKHVMTPKHINRTFRTKKMPKNAEKIKLEFTCDNCNKSYNVRNSLWYHSKKCVIIKQNEIETNKKDLNVINMIMEVVKQNSEFKELIVEQNKQIIELSSKTVINNTTTNNNSFNLQFFLNETCKDAINISDFVKQLQVGVKDLEETGRIGYAEGISKIFINGLKQLNVNQRPVHCSDSKREIIYIKDANHWTKDDNENAGLTNAIRDVAHKNIQQIPVWTEEHPEHKDLSSKYNDKYMKLVSEAMPGSTKEESDKNYKKIVRNIMKGSIIEKFIS
jgi:hypothetical protein